MKIVWPLARAFYGSAGITTLKHYMDALQERIYDLTIISVDDARQQTLPPLARPPSKTVQSKVSIMTRSHHLHPLNAFPAV